MSAVLGWIKREPVRVYSIVLGVLAVATAFGLDLSAEQRTAILALAAVVLGVGSQTVRARVSPVGPLGGPVVPVEPEPVATTPEAPEVEPEATETEATETEGPEV